MNFSGYFCLVAAAVLVGFAQQSGAGDIFDNDASIILKEAFSNGTQMLSISRSTMLDAVLAAENIVGQNPEGARKLMQQSLVDGMSIAYNTGSPFYGGIGESLNLSNDGARQGLLSAIDYIEKGAFAFLNIINSGESLFNDGSEAGGKAAKLSLNVYCLAIETGFAAMFYDVKKSANESLQAVRDAQTSPIQLQIENRNCGVSAKGDPECSNALKDINQVARNALRNGANPALVQELKEIVKCALDSYLQIDVDGDRILANFKKIADIDTFAATTMFSKQAEVFKKRVNRLFVQLYLDFGSVCARSGHQSDKEVDSAFSVLEKGNVVIYNTITFNEQILKTGLENGGDASMLAFETVLNSVNFTKLVFVQSIVECARDVLSIL